MNEIAILHIPESQYCFATDTNTVRLRVRLDKSDTPSAVNVLYGGKYTFARERLAARMSLAYKDRLYAYYTVTLRLSDPRLAYVFELVDGGKTFYFSEDGLTEKYDFEYSYYNCFQYAYINDCDVMKSVEWMRSATFYQIFVDRFDIGDTAKDKSYINLKWGDVPNPKSFAGGDIKGVTRRLEYLRSLGISALYLTPIFESVSNHKYDISDYYEIDKHFGNKSDLKELVEKAHAAGIAIVLDAVFNHCSENLCEFRDVVKNGKKSRYYDWFIIKNDDPLEYETFGDCAYMPKFNTSNPEVRDYLVDIATYWIKEFDIDGWRLDVSDEVSHLFWRQLRSAVKSVKPNCVLIGENWHDANAYLRGNEFDGVMNYAFTKACLDFYAFGAFDAEAFACKLNELLMRNTDTVNSMMLNLLDTHDTHRFLTQAGGDKNKLMSALAVTYFFTGVPCIFYGTENCVEGGYDPDCRRTFDWAAERVDNPVKSLVKTLTALKHDTAFADAGIAIGARNGLLFIDRGEYRLTINESGGDRKLAVRSAIASNKYKDGVLSSGGFAVEKA